MFDFSIVTQWFDALLRDTLGLGDFLSILIECVLVGVGILVGYALIAIVLIFMERKVCAYFQGPVCASTIPDICIVPVKITAVIRQRQSDIS